MDKIRKAKDLLKKAMFRHNMLYEEEYPNDYSDMEWLCDSWNIDVSSMRNGVDSINNELDSDNPDEGEIEDLIDDMLGEANSVLDGIRNDDDLPSAVSPSDEIIETWENYVYLLDAFSDKHSNTNDKLEKSVKEFKKALKKSLPELQENTASADWRKYKRDLKREKFKKDFFPKFNKLMKRFNSLDFTDFTTIYSFSSLINYLDVNRYKDLYRTVDRLLGTIDLSDSQSTYSDYLSGLQDIKNIYPEDFLRFPDDDY